MSRDESMKWGEWWYGIKNIYGMSFYIDYKMASPKMIRSVGSDYEEAQ